MIQWMLAVWSQIPLSFLNLAWASENSWFTYCWSFAWRILSITLLACEMSATVWLFEHSLALPFKEIKPVNPKGNQSWIFIGRTDAEAEAPLLWPPDVKNWLIGKDPDAGKDWRQEKGMTENEMVGWHHWLNGHELSTLWEMVKDREAWHATVHGVSESDTAERLNNSRRKPSFLGVR